MRRTFTVTVEDLCLHCRMTGVPCERCGGSGLSDAPHYTSEQIESEFISVDLPGVAIRVERS